MFNVSQSNDLVRKVIKNIFQKDQVFLFVVILEILTQTSPLVFIRA